jgi:hypothetical protein
MIDELKDEGFDALITYLEQLEARVTEALKRAQGAQDHE